MLAGEMTKHAQDSIPKESGTENVRPPEAATLPMDTVQSWVVLIAGFLLCSVTFGMIVSSGVYLVEYVVYFKCTRQEAALVGSAMYGATCVSGIFSNFFSKRIGCRLTIILGGSIASLGLFTCYFAPSIEAITIFHCIAGCGLGITAPSIMGIQGEYFHKYRNFAMSFVSVGGAMGVLIFPPFYYYTIEKYGIHGSFLINSGITLHMLVGGMFLKSRVRYAHCRFIDLMDVSLFRDKLMWLVCLYSLLWGGGAYIFYAFINIKMVREGIPLWQSALLVSLVSLANIVGRVITAICSNMQRVNRGLYCSIATLFAALASWLLVPCKSLPAFAGAAALFNLGFGSVISISAPYYADIFGYKRITAAISYAMFSVGLGGCALPVLAGMLADWQTVDYALMLSAMLNTIAVCAISAVFIIHYRQTREAARRNKETAAICDRTE